MKPLIGNCHPAPDAEYAGCIGIQPSLGTLLVSWGGYEPGKYQFNPNILPKLKQDRQIPVAWMGTQQNNGLWKEGKVVESDVIEVATALRNHTNLAGQPQMCIGRLGLEPWNKNWSGPDTPLGHKTWYETIAAIFRDNGCGPERLLLTQCFYPSGCAVSDVHKWIAPSVRMLCVDAYVDRCYIPGTKEYALMERIAALSVALGLPLGMLESGISNIPMADTGRVIDYLDRKCDWVAEHNVVALQFASANWTKHNLPGWLDGRLSLNPVAQAWFKARVAAMNPLPGPFDAGDAYQAAGKFVLSQGSQA